MARNQEKLMLVQDAWTELTDSNATEVTFQVLHGAAYVRGTPDATAPVETFGLLYGTGKGELAVSMNELFAAGDCVRLWARAVDFQTEVYVDHA